MRTIAIINQKGGCGKTTTAINLAAVLAEHGQRTLLVDLDPQAHCAAGLAIPQEQIEFDIGDAMLRVGDAGFEAERLLWRVSKNLDLAPSRTKLAGLEASRGGLASATERERRLSGVLEKVNAETADDPIAFVVIDCPPSIGLLAYNAITAADEIIIPVETSFFSLQGATKQVATIRSLSRRLGTKPTARLLATMHDPSHGLARDLKDEMERRFTGAMIPVTIRHDPAVREAASYGQPVGEYAAESPGARDYAALGVWVCDQSGSGTVDAAQIEVKQTDVPLGARRKPKDGSAKGSVEPKGRSGFGRAKPLAPVEGVSAAAVPVPEDAVTVDAVTDAAAAEPAAVSAISRVEDLCRRAQALHDRIRPESAEPVTDATRLRSVDGTVRLVEQPVDRSRREKQVGRLFGVRRASGSLLFVQPIELGLDVRVAGEFNGWNAGTAQMRRNESMGVHELTIPVTPGRYRYRLVVDGVWREDPFNPVSEPNEFGETNSVIEFE